MQKKIGKNYDCVYSTALIYIAYLVENTVYKLIIQIGISLHV